MTDNQKTIKKPLYKNWLFLLLIICALLFLAAIVILFALKIINASTCWLLLIPAFVSFSISFLSVTQLHVKAQYLLDVFQANEMKTKLSTLEDVFESQIKSLSLDLNSRHEKLTKKLDSTIHKQYELKESVSILQTEIRHLERSSLKEARKMNEHHLTIIKHTPLASEPRVESALAQLKEATYALLRADITSQK